MRQSAIVAALLLAFVSTFVMVDPAYAAVSVSRAEVSGSNLRIEGAAIANRDITVDGVIMGRSDSGGQFRIDRSPFTPPADCTVDVNDGSATPRVTTLSGCAVTAPPPPSAFAIDDRPLPDGNVGTDYNNFVTATGGNGTPYRWSIAAGALPAGLALSDFASASGLISGRPTTVQVSTFTVRATDQAGNSTTRQFTITINQARPLVITSPPQLPAGTVGAAYAVGVFADGGTTPYTWAQTAGTLPPGLALQASPGRIQGTPSAAGTFSFTLRVNDSAGQSATGTFSITVNAPAPPPAPPGTPSLVSPADGASVITPFSISWTAVPDPVGITHYNWSVSTVSNFATTAAVGTTPGDVTQATVNNLANGTYFWRVQAVNAAFGAGAFSAVRSFIVTGTTNPPALSGFSVNPANVTGGSPATGTVSITLPAPAGGTTIGLANSQPSVATLPASITVAAGQTSATFTVTTQPVTSSFTVVITATLGGDNRFVFLSVAPASPPPAADTVAIQRAEYDANKRTLMVEATSTNASATLTVFNTATNVQIGTLANQGGGRYQATFSNVATNPGNVTVKSSLGGAASRNVTVK
ncbi:Ig domain-containing protein [Arthrobacter cavernae]|uniref:Ig domain-containing protein n=1 Tax=Arthrobacter cavernae TaxID=2817681 RepID=A0A939HJD3_9MICC|nr:Ig domain-containing protein [Arthrobacter cavernae]MBO1269590.1 putative Ig domain-containing protein [Arthrobacter cavernae]